MYHNFPKHWFNYYNTKTSARDLKIPSMINFYPEAPFHCTKLIQNFIRPTRQLNFFFPHIFSGPTFFYPTLFPKGLTNFLKVL